MDIRSGLEYRYLNFYDCNKLGNTKYDYAKYGILNRCLPKILFSGNTILTSFIQAIDVRLVLLFKYIDKLKHFKHISLL